MRALLVAEFPGALQAAEVCLEARIDRAAVLAHHVEERILRDRPVARIEDGRANEPHRSSVLAPNVLLAFVAAGCGRLGLQKSVGLTLAEAELRRGPGHALDKVELVPGMEDRRPVQAESVLLAGGSHYRLAGRGRRGLVRAPAHREFGPPEVGHDPTAGQVVAEVAEPRRGGCGRAGIARASVNGVAIAADSPIVPEIRGGDAGHGKAGCETIAHGAARRWSQNAVHPLRRCDVSLEDTEYVLQGKTTGVDAAGAGEEEVLVQHEGDDGKELRRTTDIVLVGWRGRQDAEVPAVGIVHAAVAVGQPVGL